MKFLINFLNGGTVASLTAPFSTPMTGRPFVQLGHDRAAYLGHLFQLVLEFFFVGQLVLVQPFDAFLALPRHFFLVGLAHFVSVFLHRLLQSINVSFQVVLDRDPVSLTVVLFLVPVDRVSFKLPSNE